MRTGRRTGRNTKRTKTRTKTSDEDDGDGDGDSDDDDDDDDDERRHRDDTRGVDERTDGAQTGWTSCCVRGYARFMLAVWAGRGAQAAVATIGCALGGQKYNGHLSVAPPMGCAPGRRE